MGETLNVVFNACEDGTYAIYVKESWSGRTVRGTFIPPYSARQLNTLQKKLARLDSRDQELRDVGWRLFAALCGFDTTHSSWRDPDDFAVQNILRTVIIRTLKRRGTVALMLGFGPGCDEFIRYPWELLYNGDHFLLVSGIFTLSRVLARPENPVGCELPVHPPFRILYISSSPADCIPLETERSFDAMRQALSPLIDAGHIYLDRLEPPTFGQLVRYLNSYGGAGMLDDSDTIIPCYVIHFDGHGVYGRLCSHNDCGTMNEPDARVCRDCGASLIHSKPQTYLCFCNEEGLNQFIDTHSLRGLLLSSDIRLAVFSACETALVQQPQSSKKNGQGAVSRSAVDSTLATALVTAQVPAVVAMPFSLQDDLSPTFMYHFYEALADGRTLEEALSRSRQAMLPMQQKSWFIPVLYRSVADGEVAPVPLMVVDDSVEEYTHPFAEFGAPTTFVGRVQELQDVEKLLTTAATGLADQRMGNQSFRHQGSQYVHHFALTGSPGIGKSALAFEVVRRNRGKFPGGIIGISLRNGKSLADALGDMLSRLHVPARSIATMNVMQKERQLLALLRSLASRELPCLLLLDGLEEVSQQSELETWLRFLGSVPPEVIVLVTSHSNPGHKMAFNVAHYRWYEYRLLRMSEEDLFALFVVLARESGLDQRIRLQDVHQQAILREICTLLDGHPLGAELIFGTARSINGITYTPEAATRSLEEVRDELYNTPLAGMQAVLEISYQRLTPLAQSLLSYLSAFTLPFRREQIQMLVTSHLLERSKLNSIEMLKNSVVTLAENWRAARDELVQTSFMHFDGQVYTIHQQIRHFALTHLPLAERQEVHRLIAAYYLKEKTISVEEGVAAFEHFEQAGEPQDWHKAIEVAVRLSDIVIGQGNISDLLPVLHRAVAYASRLNDNTGEAQIQCCLGALLRSCGQLVEAEAYLRSSLSLYRQELATGKDVQLAIGRVLSELAELFCASGDVQQALTSATEAFNGYHKQQDEERIAWIQLILGEVRYENDEYEQALEHCSTALVSFQHRSIKQGWARALACRGRIYQVWGRYTQALQDYDDALRLLKEAGQHLYWARVLIDKGITLVALQKIDQAEKIGQEAYAFFQEQKLHHDLARSLCVLGDCAFYAKNWQEAQQFYEDALNWSKNNSNPSILTTVLLKRGTLFLKKDAYHEARYAYEQAEMYARSQGSKRYLAYALRGLGDVFNAFHQSVQAFTTYQQALDLVEKIGLRPEQYMLYIRCGLLGEEQKQVANALTYFQQAQTLQRASAIPLDPEIDDHIEHLVHQVDTLSTAQAPEEPLGPMDTLLKRHQETT